MEGRRSSPTRRTPPAVPVPRPVQSLAYGLRPVQYLQRARARLGPTFLARVLDQDWVIVSEPEDTRAVLALSGADADSGVANASLRPVVGTRNVLLLDGPEHLARRRLVLPAFHGDRMRAYAAVVERAVDAELDGWTDATPRPFLEAAHRITFDVILRAVFGAREPAALRDALGGLLGWITEMRQMVVFGLLGPDRLMRLPGFRRRVEEVDRLVHAEIAERRRGAPGEDVMSMLMEQLGDDELRDELVTLLVAGHETTSSLLAFAVHDLARAPAQYALLREDVDRADAVVTETLRLHPPVPLVVRRLRHDARLAGYDLPAGTTVAPCGMLLHRDPALYPAPLRFDPGRWSGGARPPAGAFLPFGGGTRRCVGAAFAGLEARIVLQRLAGRFARLTPAGGPGAPAEPLGRRGIVLVPGRGALVSAA